jgi:hypothetical protein
MSQVQWPRRRSFLRFAHQPIKLLSDASPKAEHFFNSACILGMVLYIEAQHGFNPGWNCDEIGRIR